MKSSKVKKILSITIIALVLAITVLTIVFALVPKKLYNPVTTDYTYVYVHQKDNDYGSFMKNNDEQKKEIDKINELLSDSTKDNLLSSIFQGTSKFDYRVVVEKATVSSITSSGTYLIFGGYTGDAEENAVLEDGTADGSSTDGKMLIFKGEKYKNAQSTTPKLTIRYQKMIMPLSNDTDFQERVVYLVDKDGNSNYQIKFLAHQSDLYNYVESLTGLASKN